MPCSIKYYSPQGSLYLTQALPFPTLLSLSDYVLVFGLLQLLLAAALAPLNMVLYYRWEMMIEI